MHCRFPEILAPVGGREQLEAAVKAGANAVYLAGTAFGARSSAANFDREQMVAAIRYAHLHDVSVYITVNTLILDSEFESAVDFVDFLYRNDADALIVQDIGLMSVIRERYPDFELHASTQMTFHNLEGVKYAKKLGFSRVVLPREMSIDEIKRISEEVDIELEVFIHGALCVSYSGMCLMSSYIGGRSGNRGSCAQPCRKRYSLYSLDSDRTFHIEDAKVLSPKDLSAAEAMEELLRLPKISLKIEGRLKDSYYVYHVVSAYRDLVDGKITADEASTRLEKSYNRGYTKGFLLGEKITDFRSGDHAGHRGVYLGRALGYQDGRLKIKLEDGISKGDEVQCRRPDGSSIGTRADRIEVGGKHVPFAPSGTVISIPFKHRVLKGELLYKTYSVEHNAGIDREMNRDAKIWKVIVDARFRIGELSRLSAFVYRRDDDVRVEQPVLTEEVSGDIVAAATGRGTDRTRILEQLFKTGGTPFTIAEDVSKFDVDEGVFLPISAINEMRRTVFDRITARLERRYTERRGTSRRDDQVDDECSSDFASKETAGIFSPRPAFDMDRSRYLSLPPIIAAEDWDRYRQLVDAANIVEIGHLSHLAFSGLREKTVIGSYTLNIVNAHSLRFYLQRGVSGVEISTEIDGELVLKPSVLRSAGLESGAANCVLKPVRDTITLMRMAYCPVGAYFGGGQKCGLCKMYSFALRDEKGVEFPLLPDIRTCMAEVLSPAGKRKGKKITDIVI